MIQTVALTILMPVTAVIPTTPARLPGPSLPVTINESIRLPGPVIPSVIDRGISLPGPIAPIATVKLASVPRPAPAKQPLSAIETLRQLVKDDRPLVIKKAFDNATLPETDLMNELGLGR